MLKFGYILVLVLVIKCACSEKEKILNGTDVAKNEFPYVVCIKQSGYVTCSGIILSKRYVLTGCHCVSKTVRAFDARNITKPPVIQLISIPPDRLLVIVKSNQVSLDSEGQQIKVETVVISPRCHWNEKELPRNDFGILRLKKNIKFHNGIKAAKLASRLDLEIKLDYVIKTKKPCTVLGWGKQSSGPWEALYISRSLKKRKIILSPYDECDSAFSKKDYFKNNGLLCDQDKNKGPCIGDHGGPLICFNLIVGMSVWGDKCAGNITPVVYARIDHDFDFITNHVDLKLTPNNSSPRNQNLHGIYEIFTILLFIKQIYI